MPLACKALYDRLTAKGRERKLLTLVNALLRDNRTWQPEPPPARRSHESPQPPCPLSAVAARLWSPSSKSPAEVALS